MGERGADLRVPAPGQAKKVAMMGSLDHVTRRLIVHTSRTKRSADFIAHLEQLDRLFGPKPGRLTIPVVLVEDNGPIHVSKIALAALRARSTGSPSSGCPNTHLNSMTSRLSGAISRRIIWPIRHSPTSPPSTKPSMTPSSISTASGVWKRSHGRATKAPSDERGGQPICSTYSRRATPRLYAFRPKTGVDVRTRRARWAALVAPQLMANCRIAQARRGHL